MPGTVTASADAPGLANSCELLDKLLVRQLHLMEDKIRAEVNIETHVNEGSIHLAKSRYIMGQSSVSSTQLPIETSPEFPASASCETTREDGVPHLKLIETHDAEIKVNPIRWFGVLVPQNLHKAQSIFRSAINYVVDGVNVQLQMDDNLRNIGMLKKYKCLTTSE